MFFNSLHFFLFFSLLLPLVLLLRRRVTARNSVLLAASYYFYGCWDWRFLSLIWISTVIDYWCGRQLGQIRETSDPSIAEFRARSILAVSVVTNLGILGFFKYYNFFASGFVDLLSSLGVSTQIHTLRIVLPVGISFYTFQTMSYTLDCYRGRIQPEHNFPTFALFVSFFPQLVAGPIERADRLLPQFSRSTVISPGQVYSGLYLIFWGLFQKVAIGDNVGQICDIVFAETRPSSAMVIIGTYAFAIQIYCDFSGYSDMARGVARCMGFDLMHNFNLPYFATNPADFWRRWHISLGTWLRDYLYIPLGGNRHGSGRTYVNLMLTMILGGIWHGAAWTFVVWGIYQGLLLCGHRILQPALDRIIPDSWSDSRCWRVVRVAIFFQFVCAGWLIFRAESVGQLMTFTGIVFTHFSLSLDPVPATLVVGLTLSCMLLMTMHLVQLFSGDPEFPVRLPPVARGVIYAVLALSLMCFGESRGDAFIYFQF